MVNNIFKIYSLVPWPTYASDQNSLNNFDRDQPRIIPAKFGKNPVSCFWKGVKSKILTDNDDDGQSCAKVGHITTMRTMFVLRWSKKKRANLEFSWNIQCINYAKKYRPRQNRWFNNKNQVEPAITRQNTPAYTNYFKTAFMSNCSLLNKAVDCFEIQN